MRTTLPLFRAIEFFNYKYKFFKCTFKAAAETLHTEPSDIQVKANEFNVRGWCKSVDDGSIVGRIEGEELHLFNMKIWLQLHTKQSKNGRIEFTKFKRIKKLKFDSFTIN